MPRRLALLAGAVAIEATAAGANAAEITREDCVARVDPICMANDFCRFEPSKFT